MYKKLGLVVLTLLLLAASAHANAPATMTMGGAGPAYDAVQPLAPTITMATAQDEPTRTPTCDLYAHQLAAAVANPKSGTTPPTKSDLRVATGPCGAPNASELSGQVAGSDSIGTRLTPARSYPDGAVRGTGTGDVAHGAVVWHKKGVGFAADTNVAHTGKNSGGGNDSPMVAILGDKHADQRLAPIWS